MGVYDSLACGTLCAAQAPLEGFGDCRFFNIVSIKQGGVVQTHMCRLVSLDPCRFCGMVEPFLSLVRQEPQQGYLGRSTHRRNRHLRALPWLCPHAVIPYLHFSDPGFLGLVAIIMIVLNYMQNSP